MGLITTGRGMIKDLEKSGSLALYVPLEGGFEGRYQRRLRAAGYVTHNITARGLGDLAMYLTGVHGVRPPHLGKKTVGNDAAVGYVYYVPPVLNYRLEQLPATAKGLVVDYRRPNPLPSRDRVFNSFTESRTKSKTGSRNGGDQLCKVDPSEDALVAA